MQYANFERNAKKLYNDRNIYKENKDLFKQFLEKLEYKLKRSNNNKEVDEASIKTLLGYVQKLRNVNEWFNNKPLTTISEEDMKRVYDGLEEGRYLNKRGKPFQDKKSYYNKIFRGHFFRMFEKHELARKVLEFHKGQEEAEVRFITEEEFRKIAEVVMKPTHKALAWLAFDIGENINSLLRLQKKDFMAMLYRMQELEDAGLYKPQPNHYPTAELMKIFSKEKENHD